MVRDLSFWRLSCQSGLWKKNGGGTYHAAYVTLPSSGVINLDLYLPVKASAVQIRGAGGVSTNTNCCPGLSLQVDGITMYAQEFDTGAGGERQYANFTFITPAGTHNFIWFLSNSHWYWGSGLAIVGYWD